MTAPNEDSDNPGRPPSLIRVFAVRMKKAWVLDYQLTVQSDLSLRWANSHFVVFFFVFFMRRLNLCFFVSFYFQNIPITRHALRKEPTLVFKTYV